MRENRIDDVTHEPMRPTNKGYTLRLHSGESSQSMNDSKQKVRLSRERRRQRKIRSAH